MLRKDYGVNRQMEKHVNGSSNFINTSGFKGEQERTAHLSQSSISSPMRQEGTSYGLIELQLFGHVPLLLFVGLPECLWHALTRYNEMCCLAAFRCQPLQPLQRAFPQHPSSIG